MDHHEGFAPAWRIEFAKYTKEDTVRVRQLKAWLSMLTSIPLKPDI
jgi:hypothetical protein